MRHNSAAYFSASGIMRRHTDAKSHTKESTGAKVDDVNMEAKRSLPYLGAGAPQPFHI